MAFLEIGPYCDNACIFCSGRSSIPLKKPFKNIIQTINQIHKKNPNDREWVIAGNEPTLHPNFFEILHYISQLSSKNKIRIFTNGNSFAEKSFTKKCLQIDNISIIFGIYGHTKEIHDSIYQKEGSFNTTLKGILNTVPYKKKGQSIQINIVVQKNNYTYLPKIYKLIDTHLPFINKVTTTMLDIKGEGKKNIKKTKVSYTQILENSEQLLLYAQKFGSSKFVFDNFPLCVFPKIDFFPYISHKKIPDSKIEQQIQCTTCTKKSRCMMGLPKGYSRIFGNSELHTL